MNNCMGFAIPYPPKSKSKINLAEYHDDVRAIVRMDAPISEKVSVQIRAHDPDSGGYRLPELAGSVIGAMVSARVISDDSLVDHVDIFRMESVVGGMIVVNLVRIQK